MSVVLFLVTWFLIGAFFIGLTCLFDYFYGNPNDPTTLDQVLPILALSFLGPLAIIILIVMVGDNVYHKILNGRDAKSIIIYRPRGTKQ